jgi:putative SOS response-associated peptidase YedK
MVEWGRWFLSELPLTMILELQDWPMWLGEVAGDYAALLRLAPDGLLRLWPVDRRVGSPRTNGPEFG